MPVVSKEVLKGYFEDGKEPDESKHIDLIDTMVENNPWIDYSDDSTVIGWSSTTIKDIRYKKIGNFYFVQFVIEGTSGGSGTVASFTVPETKDTDESCVNIIRVKNNSGSWVAGLQVLGNASTQVNLYSDPNGTAWTASGTKGVQGQFWYEAT